MIIEIFLALVAANRKGWGWYVALPLSIDSFCIVFIVFIKTAATAIFAVGYLLALAILGWMCMVSKEKVLPGRKGKYKSQ